MILSGIFGLVQMKDIFYHKDTKSLRIKQLNDFLVPLCPGGDCFFHWMEKGLTTKSLRHKGSKVQTIKYLLGVFVSWW